MNMAWTYQDDVLALELAERELLEGPVGHDGLSWWGEEGGADEEGRSVRSNSSIESYQNGGRTGERGRRLADRRHGLRGVG